MRRPAVLECVFGYDPLRRDRRQRLAELTTGDGRPLPNHLKTPIRRELDRLEPLLDQIKAVEAERDALPPRNRATRRRPPARCCSTSRALARSWPPSWLEGLFRLFSIRRRLASHARLSPTPWQSRFVSREQGVSKAENPRATLVELAWLWLRHQPRSALAMWFKNRVDANSGRRKQTTILALARKHRVALWKYITAGVFIEGAVMEDA